MQPKMVIFDVGRTLLDYSEFDSLKGVRALMPYISENPHHMTAEEIDQRTSEIFALFDESRKQLFEVPEKTILTLVYDASAKDPVNMAGFMIDNISKGLKQWHLADVANLPRDGSVTLLDTRTVGEYNRGHIDGFRNIPVDELRERIGEIEAGKPVYVICQSGLRSYIATRILEGYGFEAYNFAGGFRFYDAVMNDRALIEAAFACGMDK